MPPHRPGHAGPPHRLSTLALLRLKVYPHGQGGGCMGIPVALQLYTVRDELAKDFPGTLEKVAKMGYAGVEFAGYGGLSASDLKGHLERLGLMPVGSHVGL